MRTQLMARWAACFAVPAVAVSMLLAGCGDDDETTAATTAAPAPAASTSARAAPGATGENLAAFCSASVELAQLSNADSGDPGDVAAGKAFAASLLPPVQEMLANAPAAVQPELEQAVGLLETASETGDLSVFGTPEFVALDSKVHAAGLDGCGWTVQNVEMMDYHFGGLPATLPAGVTSFEVTNSGEESHVMVVVRKNDGVTESFDELLALPEEEALSKVTEMGSAFAEPGQTGYGVMDLTPGEYLALCPIPVGAVPDAEPPEDAPPHFTQGMLHEFTVS